MQIKKAHCFFEQSGTFKKEFKKLGIEAEDYDIQNNFGETDHVVDLFAEIENAFDGKPSIYDNIGEDDLIMAFFPCIYFCDASQCAFRLSNVNYRKMSVHQKVVKIVERSALRERFFTLAVKMIGAALDRNLRLVMENPYNGEHFLKNNFVQTPAYIDKDRTRRGDYFRKPTAYWYFNCEPTTGFTSEPNRNVLKVYECKSAAHSGLCSEERSLLHPTYAKNFICDLIIGKPKDKYQQGDLLGMP